MSFIIEYRPPGAVWWSLDYSYVLGHVRSQCSILFYLLSVEVTCALPESHLLKKDTTNTTFCKYFAIHVIVQ